MFDKKKNEFYSYVLSDLLFQLLLGLADPGDLGERVDNRGHAVVVDVRRAALRDRLHAHDTLVFGLVRQHGSLDAVTNGINVRHVRLELVIGGDASSVVRLDAHVLESELVRVRSTTDAHQQRITIELFKSIK